MQGIVYLLDQAGSALAQLREENQALRSELVRLQADPDDGAGGDNTA